MQNRRETSGTRTISCWTWQWQKRRKLYSAGVFLASSSLLANVNKTLKTRLPNELQYKLYHQTKTISYSNVELHKYYSLDLKRINYLLVAPHDVINQQLQLTMRGSSSLNWHLKAGNTGENCRIGAKHQLLKLTLAKKTKTILG